MTVLLTMGVIGLLFAKPKRNSDAYPQFADLSQQNAARLDQQRTVVADAAKQRYRTASLTRTKADLSVLQRLIDDKAFSKSQTYQLQCLGVAFGDVLASELPLRWAMITDEYGTDPTLRFKKTSMSINALTLISKRIEREEAVSLSDLLSTTRQRLSEFEKQVR